MKVIAVAVALAAAAILSCRFPRVEHRPTDPIKPVGCTELPDSSLFDYRTVSTSSARESIRYVFDWGDGIQDTTSLHHWGDTASAAHAWFDTGGFAIKAQAISASGLTSRNWSDPLQITVIADAKPYLSDTTDTLAATPNDQVPVSARFLDPDLDSLWVKFFYDLTGHPGRTSEWLGPVPSGAVVNSVAEYLDKGVYSVGAVAIDIHGLPSDTFVIAVVIIGTVGIEPWPPRLNGNYVYSPALLDAVNGATAFFTGDADSIYSLRDTGITHPIIWRGSLGHDGTRADGAPVLSNDRLRLYVPGDDGLLYCQNAYNLTTYYAYAHDTLPLEFTEPAVLGSTLYVNRGDSLLCLTDNQSGFVRNWACWVGRDASLPPAVSADGSRIFACSGDTGIYCISSSGQQLWSFCSAGAPTSALAIAADGTVFAGCEDGRLYGISPDDGHVVTQSTSDIGNVVGSPVIGADGTVYSVRENGIVFAFRDGSALWTRPLSGATFSAAPCLAPDTTLLVHSDEDWLYALRLADGETDWQLELPEQPRTPHRFSTTVGSSPTISGRMARIYVGANSGGEMFAIRVDKPSYALGLPETPWPKYQHDLENSGRAGTGLRF
jgi:outer membrane protein assembly factor BamB